MKKKFVFLFVIILMLVLTGCGEDNKTENKEKTTINCVIDCDDVICVLGEGSRLFPSSSIKNPTYEYAVSGDAISVNSDGVITALKTGESEVTITVKGCNGSKTVKVLVGEEGLQIKGNKTVIVKQELELELIRFGIDEDERITWKSSDTDIARVSKGVVTGIEFGKATISATYGEFKAEIEVEVIRPAITEITAVDNINLDANATYEVEYDVYPLYADPNIEVMSNSNTVIVNEDNTITTNKQGTAILTLISKVDQSVYKQVNVTVLESKAPEFSTSNDYIEVLEFNYGENVDILAGITAIDNADGDVTSTITYDEGKLLAYGNHAVTLTATDKAGNKTTFERMINVNWPYKTKFIGHAGCLYGLTNSEDTFLYAASVLHYQAIECDLHSTKDGVFVTHHDSYFYDGDTKIVIAEKTYEELMQYELTEGKYTGHIGNFERYLEICKEYGCEAIVELKWSTGIVPSDQSRMPALVQLVKDKGMWENTVFLTSMQECLIWFRTKGYNDIRLQYLVSGANNKDALTFCKKYNIDISVNVTYGSGISDEYIKKYHDAGLEISTWTFSGAYSQVQEWINKGVEYVTCDIHVMDKLDLTGEAEEEYE